MYWLINVGILIWEVFVLFKCCVCFLLEGEWVLIHSVHLLTFIYFLLGTFYLWWFLWWKWIALIWAFISFVHHRLGQVLTRSRHPLMVFITVAYIKFWFLTAVKSTYFDRWLSDVFLFWKFFAFVVTSNRWNCCASLWSFLFRFTYTIRWAIVIILPANIYWWVSKLLLYNSHIIIQLTWLR